MTFCSEVNELLQAGAGGPAREAKKLEARREKEEDYQEGIQKIVKRI